MVILDLKVLGAGMPFLSGLRPRMVLLLFGASTRKRLGGLILEPEGDGDGHSFFRDPSSSESVSAVKVEW